MATELSLSHRATVHYECRRPDTTALYQLVQERVKTFFAQVEAEKAHGLSAAEFDAFLDYCILANGFLRLRCEDCHHEKLVAFSWPLLRTTLVNPFTS